MALAYIMVFAAVKKVRNVETTRKEPNFRGVFYRTIKFLPYWSN